ncbi:uncharacterized protein LOC144130288 [Amblyomma americanum]
MRFTVVMVATLTGFAELSARSSLLVQAARLGPGSGLTALQRARLQQPRRAYNGYATGLSYVPGTAYGVGVQGYPYPAPGAIYPTGGGYGYATGLGYNRFGLRGGPNHNVFQFANVAPAGNVRRYDFTQRSIAGFFNLDDPARPFGVNFNTLRVNG